MGYNTTVVVLNDALDQIKNDPKFGEKLHDAILRLSVTDRPVDVRAGNHLNAAIAIESHHADLQAIVAIGENYADVLGAIIRPLKTSSEEFKLVVVEQLARSMGYALRKTKR